MTIQQVFKRGVVYIQSPAIAKSYNVLLVVQSSTLDYYCIAF